MQSEMDLLVLENFVLQKDEQPVGFRAWTDEGASGPDPDSPYADPRTGDPLIVTATGALNPATGTRYEVEDGIPRCFYRRMTRSSTVRTSLTSSASSTKKRPFQTTITWTTSAHCCRKPVRPFRATAQRTDSLRRTRRRHRLRHGAAHELPGNRAS